MNFYQFDESMVCKEKPKNVREMPWSWIMDNYAADSEPRSKHVAMAYLRIQGEWTYQRIASVFGTSRARVWHDVANVLQWLKAEFNSVTEKIDEEA